MGGTPSTKLQTGCWTATRPLPSKSTRAWPRCWPIWGSWVSWSSLDAAGRSKCWLIGQPGREDFATMVSVPDDVEVSASSPVEPGAGLPNRSRYDLLGFRVEVASHSSEFI